MSLKQRRFAGSRLAAQPLEEIPAELQNALVELRKAQNMTPRSPLPPSINRTREVPGTNKSVHISASPSGYSPIDNMTGEYTGVPANLATLRDLVARPPSDNVYTLAWDVNGAYSGSSDLSRAERIRTAREAERAWQEVIPQLPEGAFVANSPVGAGSGDFARADLYMQYGFSPVANDGVQYGIVRNGKIEPFSLGNDDLQHVEHLKERALKAGEKELATQLDQKIKAIEGLKDLPTEKLDLKQSSRYEYDDYDGGYDDELYVDIYGREPIQVPGTDVWVEGGTIDEAAEQVRITYERMMEPNTSVFAGTDPTFLRSEAKNLSHNVVNDIETPTASHVQELRDAQVALANLPGSAPTQFEEVLGEVSPRRLPTPITTEDLNRPSRGSSAMQFGPGTSDNGRLRANFIHGRVRNNTGLDRSSSDVDVDRAVRMRDVAKDFAQNSRANPDGVGRILQENYLADDVADLRRLQAAAAVEGLNNPNHRMAADGMGIERFNQPESYGRFSAIRRPRTEHQDTISRRRNIMLQEGDRILNRRGLTPDESAAFSIVAQADGNGTLRPFPERVNTAMEDLNSASNRGGMDLRRIQDMEQVNRAISRGEVPPRASMNGRQALDIVEQELFEPGMPAMADLQQAVANLQQMQRSNFSAIESLRGRAERALSNANRGPAAPLRRTPEARLQRPNPPAQLTEADMPETPRRARRRPAQWEDAPLVPSTGDIPF